MGPEHKLTPAPQRKIFDSKPLDTKNITHFTNPIAS